MKLRIFALVISSCITANTFGQIGRIVCDETCIMESSQTSGRSQVAQAAHDGLPTTKKEAGYPVVCPIGHGTVETITPAPRLNTLEGKTIAVVGVSFRTGITHPEIKRLIQSKYPTAKVVLLDEIGYAGVYPAPGVIRKSKEEFQRKLQQMHIDAVISGNGGCGLCTPKECGSCIAAEYLGIPSVLIAGPGFVDQAYYTATNNGVPVLRVAQYPGAFAAHTEQELLRNIREVVWPQIIEGLTRPISESELAANADRGRGDIRDDIYYGTLSEVNDYFADMDWSDGLPIIPPTVEKVSEFLRFTDAAYDATVAVLPIAHRNTTVWHVAVNGTMAGCKPEYMPILIAITKALGNASFRRTLASTHAWSPYSWLNGPVARQLGFDCGQGEINEEANMAIGRFMNLALQNLCGYKIKQDRMGTFGYLMPWTLVEDEQACRRIGWQPYHVRQGFNNDESTVTLSSALMWGNNMAPSTLNPKKIMELMARDIAERGQFALGSGKQYTPRTILITEPVAAILAKQYKSPKDLERALIHNSKRPVEERAFANYYANPGGNKDGGAHNLQQYTAHISKAECADINNMVATMREGMTAFIITGDAARNKVQIMPGGGFVTVKIELPSNWDALMREAGYRPLSEYLIR